MSVLSPALLGTVGLVLVAASAGHLRSPGALRDGLRAHGVLPGTVHGPVARVLGPVEALLGGAALVTALTGAPPGVTLAVSMPSALLLLLLTGYLWQVLRVTAGRVVPCACGLGDAPVSPSAVLRGGILAVLAVVGGTTAAGWSLTTAPAREVFVTLAAMVVLALAAALLPAARAVPEAALLASGPHDHGGHR
ncbi:MauE/DoxX family redox-associated membrane protein [Ornithinimicrobium cavernae]|uniref:MauE/DoxX family redox-associated membrane protein n=1 Tax=Ornithinimicrobium cavernae TaxID=2666047 RepID=UPI000D692F51|nr:MauE/DoxX family redox-associated membrane protein [Ornithinimicrobium cavernae]